MNRQSFTDTEGQFQADSIYIRVIWYAPPTALPNLGDYSGKLGNEALCLEGHQSIFET